MASVKKYLQLAETGTNYAKRMNLLSNRIFGEITRPSSLQMQKIANRLEELPKHKDPHYIDYYHRLPEAHYFFVFLRQYGLFRDEHADFCEEMKRQRNLKGKKREFAWFKPNPDRPTKFQSLKMK